MRYLVAIAALAVLLSVVPTAHIGRRHASGIELLPPLDIGPFVRQREQMGDAVFEPIAGAYSDARQQAEREPDSFGVPWMDLANRQLVVRVTSPEGAGRVRHPSSAAIKVVNTTRSFAQLRSIMDGSIDDPSLGLRGGTARVWTIGIDDESERVVFESDRVNDAFLFALARTYGPDVVAIRVDPLSGPFCSPVGQLDPAVPLPPGACGYVAPPVSRVSDFAGGPWLGLPALASGVAGLLVGLVLLWRRRRPASG